MAATEVTGRLDDWLRALDAAVVLDSDLEELVESMTTLRLAVALPALSFGNLKLLLFAIWAIK